MIKLLAGTALALLVATPALSASRGNDIPLNLVVGQIVPEGWDVRLADGVDAEAPVSWDGGTWRESLAQAADSAGYAARVEGKSVVIVRRGVGMTDEVEAVAEVEAETAAVVPVPREASAPKAEERAEKAVVVPVPRVRDAASVSKTAPRKTRTAKTFDAPTRHAARTPTVSGGGFAFVPAATPKVEAVKVASAKTYKTDAKGFATPRPRKAAPKPAPAPAWSVAPGADLEHVLTGWANKAGWSLVWDNDFTFHLTSGASFHGDFEGAVTQLVQAMSGVRPAPTVEFYGGNKTVVVGANSAGIVN